MHGPCQAARKAPFGRLTSVMSMGSGEFAPADRYPRPSASPYPRTSVLDSPRGPAGTLPASGQGGLHVAHPHRPRRPPRCPRVVRACRGAAEGALPHALGRVRARRRPARRREALDRRGGAQARGPRIPGRVHAGLRRGHGGEARPVRRRRLLHDGGAADRCGRPGGLRPPRRRLHRDSLRDRHALRTRRLWRDDRGALRRAPLARGGLRPRRGPPPPRDVEPRAVVHDHRRDLPVQGVGPRRRARAALARHGERGHLADEARGRRLRAGLDPALRRRPRLLHGAGTPSGGLGGPTVPRPRGRRHRVDAGSPRGARRPGVRAPRLRPSSAAP